MQPPTTPTTHHSTIHSRLSSPSPSTPVSIPPSSISKSHSSRRWADLPAGVLLLIVSHTSFRDVDRLAHVNRRLQRLVVLEPAVGAASHSVWRHWPLVTFEVEEGYRNERWVRVNDDCIDCADRGVDFVSSLLFVVQDVTALHLTFRTYGPPHEGVSIALYSSVQHFTQLRSLKLLGVVHFTPVYVALAAALDSLPSLVQLELRIVRDTYDGTLAASLHRLCSEQLDHLSISSDQLLSVIQCLQGTAMPRLRSLTVTPGALLKPLNTVDGSFIDWFPSLSHLTVWCRGFMRMVPSSQMLHLTSLTVHVPSTTVLDHIDTRTLCFVCTERRPAEWSGPAITDMLERAARIQQLSISYPDNDKPAGDFISPVFPPTSALFPGFARLSYLDYIDGLTLADITYLLTSSSPPVFAAQLTHLALRVHEWDRAEAAILLTSLPSMYQSLTHVHVGVLDRWKHARLADCIEWDVAVQSVRAAVGTAWCTSVDDVVAWREDVAWRREAGLPAQSRLADWRE